MLDGEECAFEGGAPLAGIVFALASPKQDGCWGARGRRDSREGEEGSGDGDDGGEGISKGFGTMPEQGKLRKTAPPLAEAEEMYLRRLPMSLLFLRRQPLHHPH